MKADVIVYVHDIISASRSFPLTPQGIISRFITGRYLEYLENADHILAASELTKDQIIEKTNYDGKMDVVYQGVDNLPHKSSEKRDIDLFYVGSLADHKRPAFIRELFSEAVEKGYNVAHVTESDMKGKTYREVSEAKLAELYSRSRYYIHPSRIEGFGRCPLEAQRYGATPMAFENSINEEILGESYVKIKSVNDALENLESERNHDLISRGIRNSERFKWSKTRNELKDVLTSDSM
ncbi:glycosyltransferase [Candidatus Nanohalococcus occultus]|uniref:glycosyltransferase n=1 Tax=Candidatus Nanohalococcus occultus TaxID=2978047 RepID=UPI0039E1313F